MNIQTPQASTELVVVSALVPTEVFAPGGVEAIIKSVTDKVRAIETDISTLAGRKAISSLAYKVARSKTALDEMGKTLVANLKAQTNAIDAERRTIRERLDALQDEVRKPLTDWEDADKARVAAHELALEGILEHPQWGLTETAADIRKRLQYLENYPARDWQEFAARAAKTLEAEVARTKSLLAAAQEREAEQAEAERLRREQVEREQRERDARIAREATERAEQQAREAAARAAALAEQERQQVEAAAAEAARLAREATERAEREKAQAEERAARAEADRIASEERARLQAEEAARQAEAARVAAAEQAERDRVAARQQAEHAARQAEAARIAAAEQAERDRAAAIEAERKRVADQQASEAAAAAKREANKRHQAKINGAARDALVATGLTVEHAVVAVMAIARGDVPNVKISY